MKIKIEPPQEFVAADDFVVGKIIWHFKNYSKEQLDSLFQRAGLSQEQISGFLSKVRMDNRGVRVEVDQKFIFDMNLDQRTVIYNALSAFPENEYQYNPFRFRADNAHEWFEKSGISSDTEELVSSLLYRRGTSLLFSDINVVLPMLPKGAERTKLLKALSRKSTLLMKLHIQEDQDITLLLSYWGGGSRSKDLRPLLESLASVPGGADIDISHILTKFARARLYTYPLPSHDPVVEHRDCYWTCMNFFNDTPDDRFTNIDYVRQVLLNDYYPVPVNPTFGDVVVFYKSDGEAIHSAVYIADGILFTKNGSHFGTPWILMTMADMVAYYPTEIPLRVQIYRRKDR